MTATLFTPFRLGALDLPNRIVVSPMCQYSAQDGSATPGTGSIWARWRRAVPGCC